MAQEDVFWEDFWIEVELHPYGRLKLLGLMLQDYDWLADEQIRSLPSRTLVIQLLQTHVVEPEFSEQEIASWSDDHVQHIAVAWWNEQAQDLALEPLPEASSFDLIKAGLLHLYEQKIAPQQNRLRDFLSSQQRLLSGLTGVAISLPSFNPIFPALESGLTSRLAGIRLPAQELQQFADMSSRLQGFYQQIMKSTSILNTQAFSLASQLEQIKIPLLDPSAFFGALPDLSQLKRFFEQAQQAQKEHAIFDESGYSFISHLISARVVSHFALYPERVRAANIANVLRGVTCDPRFESLLAERFEPSLVLRRRWKVLKQALHAHRRREYALSIPVFLAQVEGIIGDALLLKGKVCVVRKGQVVNGKTMKKMFLCRKGPNGKPALYTTGMKQGQPQEIHGMHDLITESKWTNHPELEETAKLITDQLAGDRNGIAHGRRLDYGTAKLSIQALLLLRVLAEHVHAFETGQVRTAL